MCAMRRLPFDSAHFVTALLGTALGLQVAWMATGALGARPGEALSNGALPPITNPFETIKAARLFGSPTDTPATPIASVSTQGLSLVGVLASTDPREGRAIIGESGGGARVYAVGSTLPGGSRLAEVHADRVILDRGGAFETLPLPRQGGTPSAISTDASAATVSPVLALPPGEDLANVIRWQAVMRADRPSGVRVYPGSDAQRFTQLGLQAGDLILAVNDAPLADQANGEQFLRTLAGAPQARLTVERNGRTEIVTVDLTAAARGTP